MTADQAGNNLEAVGVAVTGLAAYAPEGTAVPTPAEGNKSDMKLPSGWKKMGLRTEDGAPEWAEEKGGNAITFFEDGYELPSGLANVSVKMTLAETDPRVDEFRSGAIYDSDSHTMIDGGGNTNVYPIFTELLFKNGVIERRCAPRCTVKSVKDVKPERGKVVGYEVEFTVHRFDSKHHYHKWLVQPEASPQPTPES